MSPRTPFHRRVFWISLLVLPLLFCRGIDAQPCPEVLDENHLGPGTITEFVRIRIMDAWVHEQDIRRALNIPGELDGSVASHAVGRVSQAMPFVVARKAKAPDGVIVVFNITGLAGSVVSVAVEGGRGSVLDSEPESPTVRITSDLETFACLGCGRWDPAEALSLGKIKVAGDTALGETIVHQMNIMV